MKILIPLAVDFGPHGGFRVISELANNWIRQGHQVDFLVYCKFKKPYFPTQARILFYNSFGTIVESDSKDFLFLGPLQLQYALKKALTKIDADVILATQCFSAEPVAKSLSRAKKYYYIQAYEPEYYVGGLKNWLFRKISERSYLQNLIHIVNSPMYYNYREIKAEKCVFPGLDLEIFSPKHSQFLNKKLILGTIGRVEAIKGTSDILESFSYLRNLYGDQMELHIAFGKEEWGDLPGVKFLKPENDGQLAEYYRSIDIYICAGKYQLDAVHYPVIEAMACKTPVLSTGYYPADETTAYMLDVNNSQSISKKVIEVLNNINAAKMKSENALEKIYQFDWRIVSRQMIKYFEE